MCQMEKKNKNSKSTIVADCLSLTFTLFMSQRLMWKADMTASSSIVVAFTDELRLLGSPSLQSLR